MSRNKAFFSNTIQLMFGNMGAQAINLLTIPIITRIYSPNSYGLLILFLAISMFFVSMSNLRLNVAILLPKDEEDAVTILAICLIILTLISSFILILGLFIYYLEIQMIAVYQDFLKYVVFFTGYVFLQGAFLIFNTWHVRKNQFKILSTTNICQVSLDKGIAITLGYVLGDNPLWLMIGATFGSLVPTIILFFSGISKELKRVYQTITNTIIASTLSRYKTFLIYSPINLLETSSREITPVLFGVFFGSTIVGYFGLASRIMRRPLNIFGDAISRSFFHELADANRNNKNYADVVYDLFYYLLLLGIVPVIMFSLIAPELIGIIFGQTWEASGVYVSILAFPFFSNFLYRPLSMVFEIQERQGLRFAVTNIKIIAIPLAIYLGAKTGSPILTISLFAVTVFILDFIFIFLILKIAHIDLYRLAKRTFNCFILIICSISPVVWAKFHGASESPIVLISGAIVTTILFFLCIVTLDKRINFFLNKCFCRLKGQATTE